MRFGKRLGVYDLIDFADAHSRGNVVLKHVVLEHVASQDATAAFYNLHHHEVIRKYADLCIGTIANETPEVLNPEPGNLSPVPYAEPLWIPMRKFIDIYVTLEAQEKEKDGAHISQGLVERMAKENIHTIRLGPGQYLHGRTLLGGVVEGKNLEFFHELVVWHVGWSCHWSYVVHWLPYGDLRTSVIDEALAGKKKICVAISEALAGPDGNHYIVSGIKKWITNGIFTDYFITRYKTDKGFSVLLIPRSTAFVQFDKLMVPVDHLLAEVHKSFTVVMSNFNHERFAMICESIQGTCDIVEECLKWSQAWLEQITEQIVKMSYMEQAIHLVTHEVANEAVNIFGGGGSTQTRMGRLARNFPQTYEFNANLGGAEEILSDLAVRQAMKKFPNSVL
ncbi:acyl-CoA dehydrogenase/oxidase [Dactylonectria estremocensis]|uniref:Acyl-CoA dehydrogenase/oxidase n=1 Tax=Dactylonectria estremocensis TaxID=1079267 RepID=A0A9P9D1T3_9HYPO|nr:acyl-CoA dehydrogenase/oxidase [Dactylonectria estremocensis]